jgi:Meckel syndrome type 1 protein
MPRAAILAAVTLALVAAPVAGAWAATVEDRYGPPPPADLSAPATASPSAGWLSWSGKTPAEAPARPAVRSTFEPLPRPAVSAWTPAVQHMPDRIATAALPTSLYSPAPKPAASSPARPADEPQNAEARLAEARAAPPAPWTSMGQASAAATPQTAAQAQTGLRPHFYSVARQYGVTPDPIPLPKQFFSDGSADLAAPPPPPAPHPFAGSQAANSPANTAANRAREVELETADSAAD